MGDAAVAPARTAEFYRKRMRGWVADPEDVESETQWHQEGDTFVQGAVPASIETTTDVVAQEVRVPRVWTRVIAAIPELKWFINSYVQSMSDDFWPTNFAQLPLLSNSSAPQGTGVNKCLGNQIWLKSLKVRIKVENTDAETNQELWRVIVVRDSQAENFITSTVNPNGQILNSVEITADFVPAQVGPDKRFQVLDDRTINQQKRVTGADRAPMSFDFELENEKVTWVSNGSFPYWDKNFYVLYRYYDGTVHFNLPTISVDCMAVFVDP